MTQDSKIIQFCKVHLNVLGECSVRTMFGSHGVAINGYTVAHVHGGKLYLRQCDANSTQLHSLGGARYCYQKGGRFGSHEVKTNYYSVPPFVWETPQFLIMVKDALSDAIERKAIMESPTRRIRDAMNLTLNHECKLLEHGIVNHSDLVASGAVTAYRLLANSPASVNKKLLLQLEGAINNVHWTLVSEQRKNELIAQINH
ncbi:TPA: TfoX/Sxy family DNA transformation protein [Vibrio vulnificus]